MHELEKDDSVHEPTSAVSSEALVDEKYTIPLTENEIFYINDMLTMIDVSDPNTGEPVDAGMIIPSKIGRSRRMGIPASKRVIKRIGLGLLEITALNIEEDGKSLRRLGGSGHDSRNSAPRSIQIEFDMTDLWALREISYSYVVMDGEKVGRNLSTKIAMALHGIEYTSESLLKGIYPSGLPEGDEELLDDGVTPRLFHLKGGME